MFAQKNNFLKIFWFLFYIFVFSFLLKNSFSYLDNDFGWHIKVGEDIIKEKQVPHINYYNYTLNKEKWVDHEWLTNGFIYFIYNKCGYIAVNIFFTLLLLTTLILLHLFTVSRFLSNAPDIPKQINNFSKNLISIFIVIFQIFGLMAIAPHTGVRMQIIALFNLLLLLIIINNYEDKKNPKILFWLPPLFYFWASSHGSFLFGLFILFFWLIIKTAELFLKNQKPKFAYIFDFSKTLKPIQIKHFFIFSILSLLITFTTPYKLELYRFLVGYSDTYYLKNIAEWLPAYSLPIQIYQLGYLALIMIAIVFTVIYSIKKMKKNIGGNENDNYYKINLWQTIIIILLTIMAFKSKRHFPLLFIASFPFLIDFYTNFLYFSPKFFYEKKLNPALLIIKIYIMAGLLTVIIGTAVKINFIANPFSAFCEDFPCKAVEYLKKNKQFHNLNLFNTYGWGGYLIWVWPEKQLFIDGRFPQYEFAGHSILEEYNEFFNDKKTENKLNQHNIGLILLKKDNLNFRLNWFEKYIIRIDQNKFSQKENNLINILNNLTNWQMIYEDNVSIIYAKSNK